MFDWKTRQGSFTKHLAYVMLSSARTLTYHASKAKQQTHLQAQVGTGILHAGDFEI